MKSDMKIGTKEAIWLFIILFTSKVFFYDIAYFVKISGTAAYIQTAYCSVIAVVVFWVLSCIYKNFEGKDLFDIMQYCFGKAGRVILGSFFLIYTLANTILMLRAYSGGISAISLFDFPVYYIIIFAAAIMLVSAFSGLEAMSRLSFIGGVVVVSLLVSIFLLDIEHFDYLNIYPALGNGALKIASGATGATFFSDIIYLFFITPFIKIGQFKKTGFYALVSSAVILTLATVVYVFTVPYPVSQIFQLPILQIVAGINVPIIFQRLESVYLVLWIFSAFLYLSFMFYFSLLAAKKTFGVSNYKAIIWIMMIIVLSFSAILDDLNVLSAMYELIQYTLSVVIVGIVGVVFVISNIKRRYYLK